MKRFLTLALTCCLLGSMMGCQSSQTTQTSSDASTQAETSTAQATPSTSQTKIPISIATASMGGAYYPMGVGMAEIFTECIPQVETRVEVTGGTIENPGLLQLGDCEIGLANQDMALFAYQGEAPFDMEHTDLRGFINGFSPGVVHYAVLESSGIDSLSDLAGKRIAVGPQGNSTSLFLEKVLNVLGLTWDDIEPSYLSFSDGMQALADGKVDMAIASAGIPVSSVQELDATGKDWKLLEFDDTIREAFLEAYPYYIEYEIPADTYDMDQDVMSVATQNMIMINANVDEDLVYEMVKAVFENMDTLTAASSAAELITLEDAPNTSVPLHPGALRYYQEMGVAD